MSLRLSMMTRNEIKDAMDNRFWLALAQAALALLRGDIGVGVFEQTNKISVYQVVSLAGQPKDCVMQVIKSLMTSAQIWDEKITHFQYQ